MHRSFCGLILGLIFATAASFAWAQEGPGSKIWNDPSEKTSREPPRLELSPGAEVASYETELRYRMIVQLIGFVLGLGVLHLIQVKLKIHRGYFWFVVGVVILGFVLSSHRPKIDPMHKPSSSDTQPTYAPTRAR